MPEQDETAIDARAEGQISLIKETFRRQRGIEIGHTSQYMYAKDFILVRDEYLRPVTEIIGQPTETTGTRAMPGIPENSATAGGEIRQGMERVCRGTVLVPLRGTRFAGDDAVLTALAEIDGRLGDGAAAPNYVLTVATHPAVVHACPATDPEEVPDGIEPDPGVCPGCDGAGVRIYVADTGLLEGAAEQHSWLHGVKGDPDPLPGPGQIGPYSGHGTFVAGVARCMAPRADIYVGSIFSTAGSALESDAVAKLNGALDFGIDIFHLSIATATRKSLPLMAFDAWRRHVREQKGVVCVVAAGNSSSWKPFWPGAFPEMVSVGALAADWRSRAQFSNYGGWVDVYAPGRGLVNAYANGDYTCQDVPYVGHKRHFYGMARWNGTSFSTPIVSGLIAARMSRTGENGREAAAELLATARSQAIPGVGAILRPCLDEQGHAGKPCCAGGSCCARR
jgi:Subtilase family